MWWPLSSRSFDLDFENRVCSVTFSVLNRLFPYLPQIITTISGWVTCYVYNKIINLQFFTNFSHFSAFTLFWLGIQYELVSSMDLGFKINWSIVSVIMGQRGVSSERRRSSCSSFSYLVTEILFRRYLSLNDNIEKIASHTGYVPANDLKMIKRYISTDAHSFFYWHYPHWS